MAISSGALLDANGDAITGQANGTQTALDVGVNVGGVQVDPRQVRPLTSADQVTVAASALPAGASTSANQSTANTSLASIASSLTHGQATSANSVPVVIASDQSPISVITTTNRGALTDRSGTASTSSTSIIAANANRKYLMVQNLSGAKMYINFGAAASQGSGSIFLAANGGSFTMEGEFLSTDQIFIIASANSSAFTAKEG